MGDIKGEKNLADAIGKCLEYLKKEKTISQKEVANKIGLEHPVNLTFSKNVNELNRTTFEKTWNRQKILEAVCNNYSLEVNLIDDNFEVTSFDSLQQNGSSDAHLNPSSDAETANGVYKHFYIYYYCENDNPRHFKVDKAKLIIEELQNQSIRAYLTFYRNNREPRVTYSGQLLSIIDDSTKILSFTRNVKTSKDAPDIYSFLILNTSSDGFQNQIMHGTFTAIGPSCGEVILEKSTENEIDGQIISPDINPIVQLSLWNRRINADEEPLQDWSDHVLSGIGNYLTILDGSYEGYVFVNGDRQFAKFRLYFDKSGTTMFRSPHTGEFSGYFRVIQENGILIAYYDYKKELQNYRVQIILGLPREGEEKLFGIFSGIDRNNRPMAGRCLLNKAKEESYEDIEIAFLSNVQKVKKIPELLDFFLGNNVDKPYYDSPLHILNFLRPDIYFKETELLQNPIHRDRLKNLSGTYRLYRLSTNRLNIISTILKLSEDGYFESKDHRRAENSYRGRAYIIETSILCFNIERWNNDRAYGGQMLFYVGGKNREGFRHLHGASILITNDPSIRCGREVLTKIDEAYVKLESEIIPLPIDNADPTKFNKLNQEHENLGYFLMGDTNNLIKTARDPDRKFVREENYGHLYFSSACYFAQKYRENMDDNDVKKWLLFNLKKAFHHGFGLTTQDQMWIKEETNNGGVFFTLPDSIKSLIDWDHFKIED